MMQCSELSLSVNLPFSRHFPPPLQTTKEIKKARARVMMEEAEKKAAEAEPVYNLAYLPLRLRTRDAYGCTESTARHVTLTTEPRCDSLHGISSATLDARSVPTLTPTRSHP